MAATIIPMPDVTLLFLGFAEFKILPDGVIAAGATLAIRYEPARSPTPQDPKCGTSICTIDAEVIFHPGGEHFSGSLVEETYDPADPEHHPAGPGAWRPLRPFTMHVPDNASSMDIKFKMTDATGTMKEPIEDYITSHHFNVASHAAHA